MSNLPVKFRTPVDADHNFIMNSWLKSYRNSPIVTHIPNEIYFNNQSKLIENTLHTAKVLLICNKEDEDQILGYLVYEMKENLLIFHFVYLKYTFRKMGIAKDAINHTIKLYEHTDKPIFITHLPRGFEDLKNRFMYVYNPFLK